VSVAMKKINGVEAVTVSLNQGNAFVRFKPGNTAKYEDVRSGIEKNGFAVRETRVRARGRLQRAQDGLRFVVSGSGESFKLNAADPPANLRVDEDVTVEAVIPAPEKNKVQDKMTIKSIAAENK
jgi:copper chaperone CopZ